MSQFPRSSTLKKKVIKPTLSLSSSAPPVFFIYLCPHWQVLASRIQPGFSSSIPFVVKLFSYTASRLSRNRAFQRAPDLRTCSGFFSLFSFLPEERKSLFIFGRRHPKRSAFGRPICQLMIFNPFGLGFFPRLLEFINPQLRHRLFENQHPFCKVLHHTDCRRANLPRA